MISCLGAGYWALFALYSVFTNIFAICVITIYIYIYIYEHIVTIELLKKNNVGFESWMFSL